jgi:hypothetical protein
MSGPAGRVYGPATGYEGFRMPSILKQTMPEGASLDLLDAVTEEMGVDADPPKGLIVHTHYSEGGQVHIFDIWESESDYREFAESRLGPAMAKVAQERGVTLPTPAGDAQESTVDAHRVVRGR